MKKKDKKLIGELVLTLLLIIAVYFTATYIIPTYSDTQNEKVDIKPPEGELVVQYIDVGQADSILITSNGHNALIDAGNEEDGPKLVKYFEQLGIKEFDFVMGTHPHEDHIGGLDDIINNFNIHNVYLPNATTTTKTFENLIDAIENKKLNITIPNIGDTITLGESEIKIIYSGDDEKNLNNASIVTKLTFGKHKFLFTGDSTTTSEKDYLDKDIDIDVLKVAHHGSDTSTSDKFLKATTPQYAIISVGKDNKYNHPSPKIVTRLEKYTSNIYQTKDLGTIIVSINKDELKIDFKKTDTNGG